MQKILHYVCEKFKDNFWCFLIIIGGGDYPGSMGVSEYCQQADSEGKFSNNQEICK